MISYAVVTPSRGLIHSRTVEAVLRNLEGALPPVYRGWYWTHDLPIPDAHERVCELGLATGADVLWVVEEDIVPPRVLHSALRLISEGAPIVAVDYPALSGRASIARHGDEIPWCFCGCTFIHRRVFEALPRPWFSTDRTWRIETLADGTQTVIELADPRPNAQKRGLQDMYFFTRAVAAGFPITPLPDVVAGHARVCKLGHTDSNVGWHDIEVRTVIERQQFE